VRVDFKGFPDLGLWTYPDKPAPYICIEPWFGVDSTAGDSGEIRTKSGIISLKPGGRFEARFSITIG
jgi:galactose mutarotase-like enzyme